MSPVADQPELEVLKDADRVAAVLSPLRRRLLAGLGDPDSAAGIARRLGLSRQRVNYHLRELERRGLIEQVGERRRRGCVERLLKARSRRWVVDPTLLSPARQPGEVGDRFSSAQLVAAGARLVGEVAELREEAAAAGRRPLTFSLETELTLGSPGAFQAFCRELTAAVARVVADHQCPGGPRGRRFRLVTGAHPLTGRTPDERPDGEESR